MSKAGAAAGTVAGNPLSGAARHQRASERLAEAQGQLASVQGQIAEAAAQLDTLAKLQQSAEADVKAAERGADGAAAAIIDRQADLMVAEGSAEEAAARQAHQAALEAHTAARAHLDEARAQLEQIRAKIQSESAPIRAHLAELEQQKQSAASLVRGLTRAQKQAHAAMGLERLQEAHGRQEQLQTRIQELRQALDDAERDLDANVVEAQAIGKEHPELAQTRELGECLDPQRAMRAILGAYLSYLDELEKHHGQPESVGLWHNGFNLVQVIANEHLTKQALAAILAETGSTLYSGIIPQARQRAEELLAAADTQRAAALAKLPAAAA